MLLCALVLPFPFLFVFSLFIIYSFYRPYPIYVHKRIVGSSWFSFPFYLFSSLSSTRMVLVRGGGGLLERLPFFFIIKPSPNLGNKCNYFIFYFSFYCYYFFLSELRNEKYPFRKHLKLYATLHFEILLCVFILLVFKAWVRKRCKDSALFSQLSPCLSGSQRTPPFPIPWQSLGNNSLILFSPVPSSSLFCSLQTSISPPNLCYAYSQVSLVMCYLSFGCSLITLIPGSVGTLTSPSPARTLWGN